MAGPSFNALLFHRGTPAFVAFDLLALNGRDVRALPLVCRKALLRHVIPADEGYVLYADHVDGPGPRSSRSCASATSRASSRM